MKFTTELIAIDPADGQLKTWAGPYIDALSYEHARVICDTKGMGYLKVTGLLYGEVDQSTGEKTDHIFWEG